MVLIRRRNKVDDELRCKFLHGQPRDLTVDQKFRLILRLLREQFPPEYPIKVRRVDGEIMMRGGYNAIDAPWGKCGLANADSPKSEGKRYFIIHLHKAASWTKMFDTLLHEWTHTLTWHLLEDHKDHGDIFHRYYGNLYRAFVED